MKKTNFFLANVKLNKGSSRVHPINGAKTEKKDHNLKLKKKILKSRA